MKVTLGYFLICPKYTNNISIIYIRIRLKHLKHVFDHDKRLASNHIQGEVGIKVPNTIGVS